MRDSRKILKYLYCIYEIKDFAGVGKKKKKNRNLFLEIVVRLQSFIMIDVHSPWSHSKRGHRAKVSHKRVAELLEGDDFFFFTLFHFFSFFPFFQ